MTDPVTVIPEDDPQPSPGLKLFVSDVRYCWKWLSTWLLGLAAMAPMALEFVPQLKDVLSPRAEHGLYSLLALLAFIARITKQPTKG